MSKDESVINGALKAFGTILAFLLMCVFAIVVGPMVWVGQELNVIDTSWKWPDETDVMCAALNKLGLHYTDDGSGIDDFPPAYDTHFALFSEEGGNRTYDICARIDKIGEATAFWMRITYHHPHPDDEEARQAWKNKSFFGQSDDGNTYYIGSDEIRKAKYYTLDFKRVRRVSEGHGWESELGWKAP